MSLSNADTLIARIYIRCRDAAKAAKEHISSTDGGNTGWISRQNNGWYVSKHRTFVAFKEWLPVDDFAFAYAPATEQAIRETEQLIGFPLPPLLRMLYTQIANGGFGPGYGITGAIGGYAFQDIDLSGDIVQAHQQAITHTDEDRQSWLDDFKEADEDEGRIGYRVGLDGKITPEWEKSLPSLWPKHFLPLCQWGCNISTYINADTGQIYQGMGGPSKDFLVAASLEEWLERWLAGENLQLM